MSAMVRAPSAAIDWPSAPTRFSLPSVTWAGPSRIRSRLPAVPTRIRVPLGSVGEGAAIPQFAPHAAIGDDRHVSPSLGEEHVAGGGDITDRGHLRHAEPEDFASRTRGAGP